MDRKFELNIGDVLETYLVTGKLGQKGVLLDGPFQMVCEAVEGQSVRLAEIDVPTRKYVLRRNLVERGEVGSFRFVKQNIQDENGDKNIG